MIISDSGPLIWLARYNLLSLLKKFFEKIVIPPSVYKEVVVIGKKKGYKDASRIEDNINKFIFVKKPKISKKSIRKVEKSLGITLGQGEIECIQLSMENNVDLLTNDEEASITAEMLNIATKGILYILLRALKEGLMSKREVLKIFGKMIEDGFWVNPETILTFRELVEKYQKID